MGSRVMLHPLAKGDPVAMSEFVLEFAIEFLLENPRTPTMREIRDEFKYRSTHSSAHHLDELESLGFIERLSSKKVKRWGFRILRWGDGRPFKILANQREGAQSTPRN